MKIICGVIICFLQLSLFTHNLFAQADSLLNEFNNVPKTAQNILTLIDITQNISDYNADSALNCAYKIQKIKIPENNRELQCKVLINSGKLTKLKGKYDEANTYLNKALEISEKYDFIPLQIISLSQIGDLNRCINLLAESLKLLYLSRNLAYTHKVNHQYPQIYDRISATYFQLATHNYYRYENIEIPNQNDIGAGKKTKNNYIRLSKVYADSALLYSKWNNDIQTSLSSLNLLGAYYGYEKQYEEAIKYFDKALELSAQNNLKTNMPNYYSNISKAYFEIKEYDKAIEYGLAGYKIAAELNILVYKSTLAYDLRISYAEIKDFENALKFHIVERETRDSIYSEQSWNNISELNKKYQTEKRQKEIEFQKNLLELKSEEVFRLNVIIIVMLVIFVVIVIGIIHIQKQKRKISAQAEKINEQYHNLERLNTFKESLTHTLVHDLKNPLSQILSSTNNQNIRFASNKMLRLVMNLLDVEKYEHTKLALNKENHTLSGVLQELEKEHTISLNGKNLQLKLHFTDCEITADKDVISRVFDNLLSNAIRFSPLNSTIDIRAEKTDTETIRIGIKNYGQTIPENELPYIFDKYQHFGKNNNPSYRSTGLGLTFCKMAIEAHGQQISVENQPDGVLFSFTLEGKNANRQKQTQPEKVTTLLPNEISLLKPFLEQLTQFEVFQISNIMRIINQIPNQSESIENIKKQIKNAAFTSNIVAYNRLVNGITGA